MKNVSVHFSSLVLPDSLSFFFFSLSLLSLFLARPGRQVRSNDHKSSRASSKSQSSENLADASKAADPKASRPSSEPSKKEDPTAHHHGPSEGKEDSHTTPIRSNGADSQASTRSLAEKAQGRGLGVGKNPLSESQVRLLVGLHYLPHEYGPAAKSLLQDLTWLKANCQYVSANGNKKKVLPQKVSQRSPEVIQSYPAARTRSGLCHIF